MMPPMPWWLWLVSLTILWACCSVLLALAAGRVFRYFRVEDRPQGRDRGFA